MKSVALFATFLVLYPAAAEMLGAISLGPRPFFLIDQMRDNSVKEKLQNCAATMDSFKVSDFSIGHRGACLQFPEHTIESYKAAIWMGAGIVECDVTFTADRQLVCRHAQCDLHTTTDVVARPDLNAKCTTPFVNGTDTAPLCCTSDFTLEEIKTLCAKMDSSGPLDGTVEEYVYGGTAAWRTDLYQYECPRVPTHKESIELIHGANLKFTPELKTPEVEMPFEGDYTQEMYAQQMIDEYVEAGVLPENVWPQSFLHVDVYYWIGNTDFGDQAVALDDKYELNVTATNALLDELVAGGAKIVAPPMWRLVEADESVELRIKPSQYAIDAKAKGLDIITWTLERTGPGLDGWYWQTTSDLEADGVSGLVEGDKYSMLYVLAFEVGVLGVFSDWPATTTFFANCYDIGLIGQEISDGGEATVLSKGGTPDDSGSALASLAGVGGLVSIFVTILFV